MNPKPVLLFIVIFIFNKYLFNKNINYTDLIILTTFITFISFLLDNLQSKNIKNLNNY
jgi:hypothetical protein